MKIVKKTPNIMKYARTESEILRRIVHVSPEFYFDCFSHFGITAHVENNATLVKTIICNK